MDASGGESAGFEVYVDGRAFTLPGRTATGADVKRLVLRGEPSELFREKGVLEAKGVPDERIADADVIALRPGMRFYTMSEARIREDLLSGIQWRAGWELRLRRRAALVVAVAGAWIVLGDRSPDGVIAKLTATAWAVSVLAAMSWPPQPEGSRRGSVLVLRPPWQRTVGVPALLVLPTIPMLLVSKSLLVANDLLALAFALVELSRTVRVTPDGVEDRSLRRRSAIRWSEVQRVARDGGAFVLHSADTAVGVQTGLTGFCEFATLALARLPAPVLRGDRDSAAFLETAAALFADRARAGSRSRWPIAGREPASGLFALLSISAIAAAVWAISWGLAEGPGRGAPAAVVCPPLRARYEGPCPLASGPPPRRGNSKPLEERWADPRSHFCLLVSIENSCDHDVSFVTFQVYLSPATSGWRRHLLRPSPGAATFVFEGLDLRRGRPEIVAVRGVTDVPVNEYTVRIENVWGA